MRGSYLHNHVLLDPIEEHFRGLQARTYREHSTGTGRVAGFVDLFIEHGRLRIACEAELSPDRVPADFEKAKQIRANLLLIVTTRPRTAAAIRRRIERLELSVPGLEECVLPLGPMLQWLALCFPLISTSNVSGKTNARVREEQGGQS